MIPGKNSFLSVIFSPMTNFTIDDHNQALQALTLLEARWENYDGNNPNKYWADIEAARAKLAVITKALKSSGLLPRTPEEERDALLDSTFPDARSKEIVREGLNNDA